MIIMYYLYIFILSYAHIYNLYIYNHIKKAFNSCELTDHFLTNKYSHEFERDISITAIEQITSTTMNINRKKELLQAREIFWQRKLKSIQPRGLNKRLG